MAYVLKVPKAEPGMESQPFQRESQTSSKVTSSKGSSSVKLPGGGQDSRTNSLTSSKVTSSKGSSSVKLPGEVQHSRTKSLTPSNVTSSKGSNSVELPGGSQGSRTKTPTPSNVMSSKGSNSVELPGGSQESRTRNLTPSNVMSSVGSNSVELPGGSQESRTKSQTPSPVTSSKGSNSVELPRIPTYQRESLTVSTVTSITGNESVVQTRSQASQMESLPSSAVTSISGGNPVEPRRVVLKQEFPGERGPSPKCVLPEGSIINLSSSSFSSSSSSSSSEDDEPDSECSASDSDDEEYYQGEEEEGENDEDDNDDSRPPPTKRAKVVLVERELPAAAPANRQKKPRVKITPKRADCLPPKARNSNPGRRKVGGRIYDSVLGKTCHWCRQKTVELHVECVRCPIRFCGPCLLNRNGEHILLESQVQWICPKCRGGCGPGCKNCCNCGPCRKSQNLEPTGQLVIVARKAGFDNVHDYLIYTKTKESPKDIASRKFGRNWTRDSGARFVFHPVKEEGGGDEESEAMEEEDGGDEMIEAVEEAELYGGSPIKVMVPKVKDEPVYLASPRKENSEVYDMEVSEDSRPKTPDPSRVQRNSLEKPSVWSCPVKSYDSSKHQTSTTGPNGSEFATELETSLLKPFSMLQFKEMWNLVKFRKPIMKLRQTRSRAIEVPGSVDGQSYLDHYPDLELKLMGAKRPEEKLGLLRGFFFWLQHSCMEGAYRPWRDAPAVDGDCVEVGQDCEIIRVLFNIDDDKNNHPEWEEKPIISHRNFQPTIYRSPIVVKQEKE